MSTALEQLATACGSAPGYHDIWGGHHPTSDSARRDLLAAMHFDMARDPAEVLDLSALGGADEPLLAQALTAIGAALRGDG